MMSQKLTTRRNVVFAGSGTAIGLLMLGLNGSSANAKDREVPATPGGIYQGTTAQGPAGPKKRKKKVSAPPPPPPPTR